MKRIVGLLAVLAMLVLSSSATAIPIRGITVSGAGSTAIVDATVYSPPTAAGCGAYYGILISRKAPGNPQYAFRSGRMNVCRDVDPSGNGWSRGELIKTFNVSRWPVAYYYVCISASQTLTNGNVSRHASCVVRKI